MTHYVALLRGINVGGNNLIKMSDLRECFDSLGLEDVTTFIQSGNVLFSTKHQSNLAQRIESALSARFGYDSRIVLRSHDQLRTAVRKAPAGFGSQPDLYRYDVVFLREPLTATAALNAIPTREGVDQAHAGDQVVYFSRLISRATQSYLSRIVGTPNYQSMTIRNWNTTIKLLALLDARTAKS